MGICNKTAWAERWVAHSCLSITIVSQTPSPRDNYHSLLDLPWFLLIPSQLYSCMLFNVPNWLWGYLSLDPLAFEWVLCTSQALNILNLQTPPNPVPDPMRTKPPRCLHQSRVWNSPPPLSWYAREPETSSSSSSLAPTPIPRPWIPVLFESFPADIRVLHET